jgi:4-amino-4-deoxy-L-arabinose transferase-like glycosyltransferase
VAVFLSFYGLSAGELYRTETVRAIIAAEFLRSGNWIVPTLYGLPFFTKPPGMYAAIALASWPVGEVREWTARLPSALAALATALLMYVLFRRHLGRTAGLVAAALVPLSFLWLDKATAAEIDMMQTAWVAAAFVCFFRALEVAEETDAPSIAPRVSYVRMSARGDMLGESRPDVAPAGTRKHRLVWFWWTLALVCVTGGVLTKWTAPAFFYLTAIPLLWWRGRLRSLLCRQHLVAAAVGASLCLAWASAAIAMGGWEPFYSTVSREALSHLSPAHHHRAYPWRESLVHPFRVWMASLPVSLFALPALVPGFARLWDERGRALLQALHCWVWPNLIFWSAVPEHGTRQSFPLFPGIAGLAALVWFGWLTGRLRWPVPRIRPLPAFAALLVAWCAVKLAFVHVVIPDRNKNREPRAKGEQIAALVPPGQTLYLYCLKDEGIMFYYRRPVRRLEKGSPLPSSTEPLYCILEASERQTEAAARQGDVLLRLADEQGAPIALLRVPPTARRQTEKLGT